MSIKILLLTLEFAPVQTTGAFRPIATAKYLPEFGVKPTVMTIDPRCSVNLYDAEQNNRLLCGLPDDLLVYHLTPKKPLRRQGPKRRFLRRLFGTTDGHYRLFHQSLRTQIKDNQSLKDISAVVVTAPPFGAARLGVEASRLLSVPLILDFRDAWTQLDVGATYLSWFHYRRQVEEERYAFENANALVTVTNRLRNLYRRSHPSFPSGCQHVVANGFEGTQFRTMELGAATDKDKFDICYVGNFYYVPRKGAVKRRLARPYLWLVYRLGHEDWSYRSPLYFFRAWQELLKRDREVGERIRFHHIGTPPAYLMEMAAEHGVTDFCKLWGFLPKHEVTDVLTGMDAMLATSMKRPDGGDYCLASKTFDYITAKKPVLAFVTEGSQRDFLINAGVAVHCDPDDAKGSAETMKALIQNGVTLRLNHTYVNQFHRREAARRLAGVIEQVTGKSSTQDEREEVAQMPYI